MILGPKELSLLQKYNKVIGVDEAGRGPLAGPIVASAIALDKDMAEALSSLGVNDSKKTTRKKREQIVEFVLSQKIPFATFKISSTDIDKIGILPANTSVLETARTKISPHISGYTIIDGRFAPPFKLENYEITVRADSTFIAVATASILAKTHRDFLMEKEAKKYPDYGFERHMGYGTKAHIAAIYEFGPCEIHRKTFEPIKSMLA